MINGKEFLLNLEDLDYIKSIKAVNKYMNFGISSLKDSQDKILHYKVLEEKFAESQNKIEDNLDYIEFISDNQFPIRKRGVLFEKVECNVARVITKKKSKILIIIKINLFFHLLNFILSNYIIK